MALQMVKKKNATVWILAISPPPPHPAVRCLLSSFFFTHPPPTTLCPPPPTPTLGSGRVTAAERAEVDTVLRTVTASRRVAGAQPRGSAPPHLTHLVTEADLDNRVCVCVCMWGLQWDAVNFVAQTV